MNEEKGSNDHKVNEKPRLRYIINTTVQTLRQSNCNSSTVIETVMVYNKLGRLRFIINTMVGNVFNINTVLKIQNKVLAKIYIIIILFLVTSNGYIYVWRTEISTNLLLSISYFLSKHGYPLESKPIDESMDTELPNYYRSRGENVILK